MEGLDALAGTIDRVLREHMALEEELRSTRARRDEVEELLQRMTTGEESPARMAERLEVLSAENEDLRRRLSEGRATAERLLARVRYLEEHG